MRAGNFLLSLSVACCLSVPARAGVSIDPFVSISSTKSIKPDQKDKTKENETIKQRQTYGIRASVSFFRLMKFQLSVGQNKLTTTEKTQTAVDEYGDIDYEKDLNMSTEEDKEIKIAETQRVATTALILDPSFSIFILRARAGVQAKQRLIDAEEDGKDPVHYEGPIEYDPVAGAGAGIRLSPRMYFMAEYGFVFYKFPETEPFEREVTVSYGISF